MVHSARIFLISVVALLWTTLANAASLPDFKELVKETSPAVVNISTVQSAGGGDDQNPLGQFRGPNGEEIPEIFRHFFQMPELDKGPRRRSPQSLGLRIYHQ